MLMWRRAPQSGEAPSAPPLASFLAVVFLLAPRVFCGASAAESGEGASGGANAVIGAIATNLKDRAHPKAGEPHARVYRRVKSSARKDAAKGRRERWHGLATDMPRREEDQMRQAFGTSLEQGNFTEVLEDHAQSTQNASLEQGRANETFQDQMRQAFGTSLEQGNFTEVLEDHAQSTQNASLEQGRANETFQDQGQTESSAGASDPSGEEKLGEKTQDQGKPKADSKECEQVDLAAFPRCMTDKQNKIMAQAISMLGQPGCNKVDYCYKVTPNEAWSDQRFCKNYFASGGTWWYQCKPRGDAWKPDKPINNNNSPCDNEESTMCSKR